MEVKLVERKEIIIGGFSVETTLENNEKDLELLYNDFHKSKKDLLHGFTKNTTEYFGVIWYTKLHESYKYLLGQKIMDIIYDIETILIPEGLYAFAKFPQGYDGIKAWTDFYQVGIPKTGYKPKEISDIAFEYYPNGLNGEYELWSLVEKNV
jgi:predicted transcriptional regulator YdeE